MGWYGRSSRFIIEAFRRHNSTVPRSPIQKFVSLNTFSFRSNSRISRPFVDGAKRFYCVKVEQIKKEWRIPGPKTLLVSVGLLYFGGVTTVYFWNSELVPYTKRRQVVLLSSRQIGQSWFEARIESKYKGKIVENVRVQKIAHAIFEAVKSQRIAHLEGLEWEVIIVDNPRKLNACAFPNGKVVVYTGLLNHFKADAEIATIVGHEVAHVVARHGAEHLSKIALLRLFLHPVFKPDLVDQRIIAPLCYLRKEMEADAIGVVLMASAGYDPRAAPKFYKEFGEIGWRLTNDVCCRLLYERSRQLSRSKLMEVALSIYQGARYAAG